MKNLLIFLMLFVSSSTFTNADTVITVNYSNTKYASGQITGKTLNKAMTKLQKVVRKSKYLIGDWNNVESGYLFKRQSMSDELEYFHPNSFSVTIIDNASALESKRLARLEWIAKRKIIRNLKLDKGDETVAEWRAKIVKTLKQLVKDNLKEIK